MKSLIAKLEQASEGNRGLDEEIARSQGWDYYRGESSTPSGITRQWATWRDADLNDVELPHYTTSLDAKLPWENIVEVRAPRWNNTKPDRWEAVQRRGEPGDCVYFYGAGHTEVLARRGASLKARA